MLGKGRFLHTFLGKTMFCQVLIYNNVYANNWDAAAKNLTDKMPGVQGMWSFQLLGKVAANTQHNFPDWTYNGSKWWDGIHQNLAGGGTVNPAGSGKALVEGNPDLYLEEWPADSTVGILDKWFGAGGLGYDTTWYRYWSMDNEPEMIWFSITGYFSTGIMFILKPMG